MANRKQLKILRQGVAAWNAWREEHPDAKIDLRGAKLDGLDLSGANFCQADLSGSSFRYTNLTRVMFKGACLYGGGIINNLVFMGTILADNDVRNLLERGSGKNLSLKEKNLQGAYLVKFDFRNADLRGTDLRQTDLSVADITGAKLYGSARENWIIDGIRCDYAYWDEAGEKRTPPDRDFRPGEFEELHKKGVERNSK
ncbi:MAG: pentapeptide repeat-containing protein [Candidatus Electrothrix sp. AX5]|nr:pentapeptide repeat-containing protein [Candidatus Electrothrix sp. AX5]